MLFNGEVLASPVATLVYLCSLLCLPLVFVRTSNCGLPVLCMCGDVVIF